MIVREWLLSPQRRLTRAGSSGTLPAAGMARGSVREWQSRRSGSLSVDPTLENACLNALHCVPSWVFSVTPELASSLGMSCAYLRTKAYKSCHQGLTWTLLVVWGKLGNTSSKFSYKARHGTSSTDGKPAYTIYYYTILYYTILYYTILYYTILYYTILYYTILYYTILDYTILYYTILYSLHLLGQLACKAVQTPKGVVRLEASRVV